MNNIHSISIVIDDVSKGTKETDNASAALTRSAQELTAMVRRFRV
jgi:methyl-accepting chemotaxis protein